MFTLKNPNSISFYRSKKNPLVKLLKDPISVDWMPFHYTKDGQVVDCFLVMRNLNGVKTLTFYYQKEKFKIEAPLLFSLFDDVESGWSRSATPSDLDAMKAHSNIIKNMLVYGHVFSKGTRSESAPTTPIKNGLDLGI